MRPGAAVSAATRYMDDAPLARLVSALVATLPKPRGATARRLQRLLDPCVTVKLDGVRTLLAWDESGLWGHTVLGAERLEAEGLRAPEAFTVLDAERVGSHFYVFDALFVKGVDVRHLPLIARLRETRGCLPACASAKRYYWGPTPLLIETVQRLARSKPRLADGTRLDSIEGFIFGSVTAPYDWAPLKFKYSVTYDFLVASFQGGERPPDGARRLQLYFQVSQELAPFHSSRGAPDSVLVAAADLERMQIPPGDFGVEQGIVLELKLAQGSWQALRARKDRRRPNSLQTIEENLELQRRDKCTTRFLLSHLDALRPPGVIAHKVTDAMMRALGTCGAVLVAEAVPTLFMPSDATLQSELDEAARLPRSLVAVIAPSSWAEPPRGRRSWHRPLALDGVVQCSRRNGWSCRNIQGLRSQDFLLGLDDLPPALLHALGGLAFLLLRRSAGGVG